MRVERNPADAPTTNPRPQFRIWWLMAAVAAVAIVLSLPTVVNFLLSLAAVPALLILLPAAAAPRGRRIEVAYWAIALHPLVLLLWVAFWRLLVIRGPLGPMHTGWYHFITLDQPYAVLCVSGVYSTVLAVYAYAWAQHHRPRSPSLIRPLVFLPFSLVAVYFVLTTDVLELVAWFWD